MTKLEEVLNDNNQFLIVDKIIEYISTNSFTTISIFDEINEFLQELDYELDIEQLNYLLSNDYIYNLVASFVHNNLVKIKQMELTDLNIITETLINMYCDKNEIEIIPNIDLTSEELEYLNFLTLYNNEIPLQTLTKEETNILFKKYKEENDEQAKKILISYNLRLVKFFARKHINKGLPYKDLIQEGNIGLMKAIEKYDYTKGFRLSTYANYWINSEISSAIKNTSRVISIPVNKYSEYYNYNKVKDELYYVLGYEPSSKEIANALNIEEEKLKELLDAFKTVYSLDKITESTSGEGYGYEFVSDIDIEEDYLKKELVNELLNETSLTKREKEVILLSFGFYNNQKLTNKEIAKILNLSSERIRQIKNTALKKIKQNRRNYNNEIYGLKIEEPIIKYEKELKKLIENLPEEEKQIMNLDLGYYKGLRIDKWEKAKLCNLNIFMFNKTVNKILKKFSKSIPNITAVTKKIKYANGEQNYNDQFLRENKIKEILSELNKKDFVKDNNIINELKNKLNEEEFIKKTQYLPALDIIICALKDCYNSTLLINYILNAPIDITKIINNVKRNYKFLNLSRSSYNKALFKALKYYKLEHLEKGIKTYLLIDINRSEFIKLLKKHLIEIKINNLYDLCDLLDYYDLSSNEILLVVNKNIDKLIINYLNLNKKVLDCDKNNFILNTLIINHLNKKTKKDILSNDELMRLINNYKNGDKSALKIIVEKNKGLVSNIAKKYKNKGVDIEDLIQCGNIGLILSLDKFDITKGSFYTYASFYIEKEIKTALLMYTNSFKITKERVSLEIKYQKIKTSYLEIFKRLPSIKEYAHELNISENKVKELEKNMKSLINIEELEGNSNIELESDCNLESTYINEELTIKMQELLKSCNLSSKELDVIIKRMGLFGFRIQTQKEIANEYNVKYQYIQQIEKRALDKLRDLHDIREFVVYLNNPDEGINKINEWQSERKLKRTLKK